MNRRTFYILAVAAILALGLCLLDRRHAGKIPPGERQSTPSSPAAGQEEGPAPAGGGPTAAVKDGGSTLPGAQPRGGAQSGSGATAGSRGPSDRLAPGEQLIGQVQDIDGSPIDGAILRLARDADLSEGPEDRLARSDATGRFEFRRLREGSWLLSATSPGRLTISGLQLDAPAESPVVVVMAIDRPPTVRVIDDQGAPIAGASISTRARGLTGSPAAGVSAASGPDGQALLEGLPEEDRVPVEVRAELRDRPPASVTRTAGELRASMLVIELETGGSLGGQVIDAGGAPKSNVKLILVPVSSPSKSAASNRWTLHTVSSGVFKFTGLPRGEYDLYADGGDAGRRRVSGLQVGPAAGSEDLRIQLAAPGSAEASDAVAPPPAVAVRALQAGPISGTGAIRGRLSNGEPAPSFAVALVPQGSKEGPTRIYRQTARRSEFSCSGVPPGTYDVVLIVSGAERGRVEGVKVDAGSVAAVELTMD